MCKVWSLIVANTNAQANCQARRHGTLRVLFIIRFSLGLGFALKKDWLIERIELISRLIGVHVLATTKTKTVKNIWTGDIQSEFQIPEAPLSV